MLAHLDDQNKRIIKQIDFLRPIVSRLLEAGKRLPENGK